MRGAVAIVVQLIVSLLIVGALMPALVATMPAVRSGRAGGLTAIVGVGAMFGLLRLVWPKPKRP
jgi:hypothetical protein